MVLAIRNIESALGSFDKRPTATELKNILVARKSIHLAVPLLKGHIITETDLVMKRPGDGISPMLLDKVIGKKLITNLEAEHKISWENLE